MISVSMVNDVTRLLSDCGGDVSSSDFVDDGDMLPLFIDVLFLAAAAAACISRMFRCNRHCSFT